MDCKESQNLMSAYLDEELDPSAAAHFATHLASCAACDKAYEQLAALRAAVRAGAVNYTAPAGLRARILSDINTVDTVALQRKAAGVSGVSGIFGIFNRFGGWPWARINFGIASLACVAFAVTLALYMQTPSEADFFDQEIVATHFRSLQADHLADVASSDQHTVKPWFSGKLDYSPPVVDLAQEGFALIGGRLDYLNRRPVAGLAYRHGKHLVNLFVWPDDAKHDTAGKMTVVHGFQLLRWSHGGMAYTAVSDMNAHELLEFQQLLTAHSD